MRRLLPALALIAACRCAPPTSGQVAPAPVVAWDGGVDDSARACAVLAAAGCPVGLAPGCADALRNDQAQGAGSQVDLVCILDAGAHPAALAGCHVTCGALP